MGKKSKGSKAKKSGSGRAAAGRGGFSSSFDSHAEFEEVLKAYGHRAAVVDLNALEHGGPAWKKYLEAMGTALRDNSVLLSADSDKDLIKTYNTVDCNCPLVRGFIGMCGPQVTKLLTDKVYENLIKTLSTYGRPVPNKFELLMEHEVRVSYHYNQFQEQSKDMYIMKNTSNAIRKNIGLHTTTKTNWSDLQKMSIRDLNLYDSHEGKYIEGMLLVEPFTPMVGTTTIIEDSNGDVVLVALYNFLPDGLSGKEAVPVARAKIPKGSTIRIAEPFMKIMRDGSRGLRIDDSDDFSVINKQDDGVDEETALLHAKKAGNAFIGKKMYLAAGETYLEGIRRAELVPTLLSNRSQAYAMAEEWDRALADAAASLTIRPKNNKTWSRYNNALEEVSDSFEEDAINKTSQILRKIFPQQLDAQALHGENALSLKGEGNAAFKNKEFIKAAAYYTSALLLCGETTRALLANWSLCCIQSNTYNDALAAAAASLRIRCEEKAVIRLAKSLLILGEAHTSRDLLQSTESIVFSVMERDRKELLDSANDVAQLLENEDMKNPLLVMDQKNISRWVGDAETMDAGHKGRGVKATADIRQGQVLLIEPPVASAESEGLGGKRSEILMSMDKHDVKDSSQAFLRQAIITRSRRESIISRIVDCLSDGTNKRPVTSLCELLPSVAHCPVLLPSHHEYCSEERVELTAERVDAIVSVNSHGSGGREDKVKRFSGRTSTHLYPGISMFNHSKRPTCQQESIDECSVIVATRDIKEGEELTVCYHPNEELVRRNWGL